jgi:DNA mismatch repair protein PMS2
MKPRDDGVDDLLIVDQHASDEKYNFERLQQDTVMKSQPLVVPRALNLSVVEELTLIKHVDLFKKNGFVVRVDENKPPGQQCTLISLPSSKTLVFDENDLHELIYLVSESPANASVRCSKVRAMLAMRACRSSIMVGKPLSMSTMESVVKNLASLDKPWNCPHGRPTLRHITTIAEWVFYSEDL